MELGNYKSSLSVDEKVIMGVVRISELFKKKSSAIFKNYGLTFAQYNVLRVLNSSDDGANTVTNVSKIMLVTGANMTGLAKRLEREGFLLRKQHRQDERVTLLEITPKGKKTLQNIETEKEEHIKQYIGRLSDNDKQQLLALVRRIIGKEKSDTPE